MHSDRQLKDMDAESLDPLTMQQRRDYENGEKGGVAWDTLDSTVKS